MLKVPERDARVQGVVGSSSRGEGRGAEGT